MKEEQSIYFEKEIQSKLQPITSITLYKIFGEEFFDFEKAKYQSKVDWSGFYTQLSPQHSMRYLTKKWGDGSEMACLIRLFINDFTLRMLTVQHLALSDPKICGDVKAANIKRHLKQKYEEFNGIQHSKLLSYLGQYHILMSCIDSQDQQIIIPHSLLNKDHFRFEHIASFKRSNDGMLRTISFRKDTTWQKVPSQVQFEPYLLLEQKIWNES